MIIAGKAQCPPPEDKISSKKWEAWSLYRGLTKDEAMRQFVQMFETFAADNPDVLNKSISIMC